MRIISKSIADSQFFSNNSFTYFWESFHSEKFQTHSVESVSVSVFQPKITMISGQNITTFSCQKTNLDLVVGNAHFNIRACFQL